MMYAEELIEKLDSRIGGGGEGRAPRDPVGDGRGVNRESGRGGNEGRYQSDKARSKSAGGRW